MCYLDTSWSNAKDTAIVEAWWLSRSAAEHSADSGLQVTGLTQLVKLIFPQLLCTVMESEMRYEELNGIFLELVTKKLWLYRISCGHWGVSGKVFKQRLDIHRLEWCLKSSRKKMKVFISISESGQEYYRKELKDWLNTETVLHRAPQMLFITSDMTWSSS